MSAREDGELEPIVCLVSGADRVDLERLAAVIGRRDIRRATAREADELTGFTIGGIPPFGHTRRTRVIMDPELGRYAIVWAAAGLPTAVFPVAPATLRMLSDAHVAPDRRGATGRASLLTRRAAATPRSRTRAGCARGGAGAAPARPPRSSPCPRSAAACSISGRRSPRTRTRCVAPSSASTARRARWTLRLASTINDEPAAQHWDTAGQLVVKYGFHAYGIDARTGRAALDATAPRRRSWPCSPRRGSGTSCCRPSWRRSPIEADGAVAWRIAHSDVVAEAAMVGGRLVLTGYGGGVNAIDPATGRAAG